MIKRYGDVISGGFFLLFSVLLYLAAAFTIPPNNVTRFGADVLPKVTAAIMFCLSVAVVAGGWLRASREGKPEATNSVNRLAVILSFICIGACVFSMSYLGFVISVGIYLLLQMLILSNFNLRRLPLFLIVAVGFSTASYYFFTEALYLLLPAGLLDVI